MRSEFAKKIQILAQKDKKIIFLTGDLGFNAFENLRDAIGNRFINAGVAEQNMVDVAAGMSSTGLNVWTYSIAPFLVLKTVEQIRNDICHRNLSVKLVGNGGGFGYGIMGSTHHILEDISILAPLPNIKLFIPAYSTDVAPIVEKMNAYKGPSYLRLGLSTIKSSHYSPFRNVLKGKKITVVVLGPLLHNVLKAVENLGRDVDVWSVTEIPFKTPQAFYTSLEKTKKLLIIEEHSLHGGFGQMVNDELMKKSTKIKIVHLFSRGYVSKLYGSQAFHLKDTGLNSGNIEKNIKKMINE